MLKSFSKPTEKWVKENNIKIQLEAIDPSLDQKSREVPHHLQTRVWKEMKNIFSSG